MVGSYLANIQYFNPKQISNIILWLDATDVHANGIVPANGTSLSTWNDKSGNGNSCTQSTGAKQPVFNTNVKNGLPGIFCNSSSTIMSGTTSATGNPNLSVFVVFQYQSTASLAETLVFGNNGATNQIYGFSLNTTSPGYYNAFAFNGYESRYTPVDTNFHYLSSSRLNTTNISSLWIDGNFQTTTIGSAGALNLSSTYLVGNNNTNGYICEIIAYNKTCSTQERLLLEGYMKNKWGF